MYVKDEYSKLNYSPPSASFQIHNFRTLPMGLKIVILKYYNVVSLIICYIVLNQQRIVLHRIIKYSLLIMCEVIWFPPSLNLTFNIDVKIFTKYMTSFYLGLSLYQPKKNHSIFALQMSP